MAEACPTLRLRQEVTCSVCLEYFTDPYTVDCGHNFCRSCLSKCMAEPHTELTCPQCRVQIQPQNFKPNRPMATFVEIAKDMTGYREKKAGKNTTCRKHHEPLKLFCKSDQVRICLVCDKSEEHEGHDTIPVEAAAQEFKDLVFKSLDHIREERDKVMDYKLNMVEEHHQLMLKMEEGRDKISTAFLMLREFLVDEEIRVSSQLRKLEKEIGRKLEEQTAQVDDKLCSFDHILGRMEDMCRLPEDELLQKAGKNLQRWAREKFDKPAAFSSTLKWKVWELCDIHNFLEASVTRLQGLFESGFQLQYQKVNVTLDPATPHPNLVLSQDLKAVRWDDQAQAVPDNPRRFDICPCALGSEGFNAGKLYWDVDVDAEGDWAIGVAKESLVCKGEVVLSSEKGIFSIGKCRDRFWAFEDLHVAFPWKPLMPMKVRVVLDYIGGGVGFLDANHASVLFEFREDSFDEKLYPFFWLQKKAQLKIH